MCQSHQQRQGDSTFRLDPRDRDGSCSKETRPVPGTGHATAFRTDAEGFFVRKMTLRGRYH